MISAATAFSRNRSSVKAAEEVALKILQKNNGEVPTALILFVSSEPRRRYPEMLEKIRELTKCECIAGASGWGVLTEESELEREPGLALLSLGGDLRASSFLTTDLQENNYRAGEWLAERIRAHAIHPNLVFLFPDALSFQSHTFFEGFESLCGYIPILGGAASSNGRESKTYQMAEGRTAWDAVSALALEGRFIQESGITRSCQPFGESFQVTRSVGNMIFEMDGRPAYDILLESLTAIEPLHPSEVFQRVFLGIPLRSFQTEFKEAPFLIQNIVGVNAKKGMVACVSPVEEGEFITFAVRDPAMARIDMQSMLEDIQNRLGSAKPRFGIYFNCCARGEALYGRRGEDVSLIREAFPGMPVAGFFTYGELAPVDHVNHFHQHSGIFTVIAEET